MGDWLGDDNIASTKREYLDFEEARDIVRKLDIKTIRKNGLIIANQEKNH